MGPTASISVLNNGGAGHGILLNLPTKSITGQRENVILSELVRLQLGVAACMSWTWIGHTASSTRREQNAPESLALLKSSLFKGQKLAIGEFKLQVDGVQ